jgi:hypothetical protein
MYIRTFSGKKKQPHQTSQGQNRETITNEEDFKETLNRPLPSFSPDIPSALQLLDINTNLPTKPEFIKAMPSCPSSLARQHIPMAYHPKP